MKRLVLIGLSLLISAATAEAIDKVRMSISAVDVSFLTGGLALKRGMFRDEGLDVELIRINANVSVTALSTGDIDYTMIFGSVVRAAVRGLPMKVVASFLDSSTHMPLMLTWSGGRNRTQEMHLSDYKVVGGLKLPHLITRGVSGETSEEWTIKSYKLNPNFKANAFTK